MAHLVSAEAEADLDDIWSYIVKESGSFDIADGFIDSLTDRFWLLSGNPSIGRRRDEDLRPGMRSFPVGTFVILYRIEEGEVRILHVLRGSRDIQALLR